MDVEYGIETVSFGKLVGCDWLLKVEDVSVVARGRSAAIQTDRD